MSSGFVVIDKPEGKTSHDVVAAVRRRFGLRGKVGHAGTLDPMATGVLVVAVDRATRLLPYLLADEKEYVAEIALGRSTTTLDREGDTTEERAVPSDFREHLEEAIRGELDRREQVPPKVSAIHIGGQRAHDLARRGASFELAPRAVRLLELEMLGSTPLRFRLVVEKGYYVRSFARDLAERLGTVGHLSALRRTRSGTFSEGEAIPLDRFDGTLISLEAMARRLFPSVTLSDEDVAALHHGKERLVVPLSLEASAVGATTVALYRSDGSLVGCQEARFVGNALALGVGAVRFPST